MLKDVEIGGLTHALQCRVVNTLSIYTNKYQIDNSRDICINYLVSQSSYINHMKGRQNRRKF